MRICHMSTGKVELTDYGLIFSMLFFSLKRTGDSLILNKHQSKANPKMDKGIAGDTGYKGTANK